MSRQVTAVRAVGSLWFCFSLNVANSRFHAVSLRARADADQNALPSGSVSKGEKTLFGPVRQQTQTVFARFRPDTVSGSAVCNAREHNVAVCCACTPLYCIGKKKKKRSLHMFISRPIIKKYTVSSIETHTGVYSIVTYRFHKDACDKRRCCTFVVDRKKRHRTARCKREYREYYDVCIYPI